MEGDGYRRAHDEPGSEHALSEAIIAARTESHLTQAELAARMQTSRTAIARLGSGRANPTADTLRRLAAAAGTRLEIRFE